jgi:hypothetical protein
MWINGALPVDNQTGYRQRQTARTITVDLIDAVPTACQQSKFNFLIKKQIIMKLLTICTALPSHFYGLISTKKKGVPSCA